MRRISRDRADELFSNYIRERDGWRCQRCHKYYQPPTRALHCAHYYGRVEQNTREDPENCLSLCYGCHSYMDSHHEEFRAFMLKRLGQDRFDALVLRGNTYCKKDRKMALIKVKVLIQSQEEDNG